MIRTVIGSLVLFSEAVLTGFAVSGSVLLYLVPNEVAPWQIVVAAVPAIGLMTVLVANIVKKVLLRMFPVVTEDATAVLVAAYNGRVVEAQELLNYAEALVTEIQDPSSGAWAEAYSGLPEYMKEWVTQPDDYDSSDTLQVFSEQDASAAEKQASEPADNEPVAWQFLCDSSGKWCMGSENIKDHRKNTEAAGIPTRDLYAAPVVKESLPAEPSPAVITSAYDLVDGEHYWIRKIGSTSDDPVVVRGESIWYPSGGRLMLYLFDGNYIAEPIAAPKFAGVAHD